MSVEYDRVSACSVIIPTFKRAALVREIIDNLAAQTGGPERVEVIVCDSRSDDDTGAAVDESQRQHSGLHIVHAHTVNNLAAKRNLGVRQATTDNLIFLDDDCVPTPTFLRDHLASLAADYDKPKIVCGIVSFPQDQIRMSNYIRYRDRRHRLYDSQFRAGGALDFRTIVAMNMSVRRSQLLARDLLFDETFLGYGMEDNEFGYRAEQLGFAILACPATILHYDRSDLTSYTRKIFQTARDGMTRLLETSAAAVWDMPFAKTLEPEFPHARSWDRVRATSIRALLSRRVASAISAFLVRSDKVGWLYCPPLYRYVLATAYKQGSRSRGARLASNSDAASSWYN